MRATARTWRRGTLAVAVAGASLFAATAASGATSGTHATSTGATASAATTYAPCPSSDLTVWRGAPGDGTTGAVYYELQFSNTSSTTCTLRGFPGVSAVDRAGHQLGSSASWDHRFAPTTITVRPGTTAHALLRITDVSNYPPSSCMPVRAVGLRIYPPDTTRSHFVPLGFEACSRKGPIYLSVRTIRPRAGIPGYSQ